MSNHKKVLFSLLVLMFFSLPRPAKSLPVTFDGIMAGVTVSALALSIFSLGKLSWELWGKSRPWEKNPLIPFAIQEQITTKLKSFYDPLARLEYMKWVGKYPFGKNTMPLQVDLAKARQQLDSTHYGISYVKESIIDYLAGLWMSRGKSPKVLCFDGVPGTGKTTLAKSIAKALGKEFVSINLSCVTANDLYIEGQTWDPKGPGLLARALIDVRSANPLILLDELEKSSLEVKNAFLSILDSSQNDKIRDKYLAFDIDLSRVTFVVTVNSLALLSEPLRNRMQMIHLHPYSLAERKFIAHKMLIPQLQREMNLSDDIAQRLATLVDPLSVKVMRMEGGMRAFKRCLVIAAEKYARQIVENDQRNDASCPLIDVSSDMVLGSINPELLGDAPGDIANYSSCVGVANGLQVNGHDGGGLLKIESIVIPQGKGELILSFQAGESYRQTQIRVFAYVKTIAPLYGIDSTVFNTSDFIFGDQMYVTIDGPSAGLAHLVALVSALTKRPVRQDFAMTGAVDMHGNVLPVGGYRDKILGSEQPGIKNIIVPASAKATIENIKESFPNLQVFFVSNVHEALELLLLK